MQNCKLESHNNVRQLAITKIAKKILENITFKPTKLGTKNDIIWKWTCDISIMYDMASLLVYWKFSLYENYVAEKCAHN